MASEVLEAPRIARPANVTVGPYLCHAWGVAAQPTVAITPDRTGVVDFLCEHWFGERPETMHEDNRQAFDQLMADFDAKLWDTVESIEARFEYGGLRVTKVTDASKPIAPPPVTARHQAACDVQRTSTELLDELVRCGRVLHPATADLVVRFGAALAEKLAAAERKYGYSDNWRDPAVVSELRDDMYEHLSKGDPRDVAAYCAFLWHHRASTARTGGEGGGQ